MGMVDFEEAMKHPEGKKAIRAIKKQQKADRMAQLGFRSD